MTIKRKLSILHVVPKLSTGGTEQNAVRLARSLAKKGFENKFIAIFPGDESMRFAIEEISQYPIEILPNKRLQRLFGFMLAVMSSRPKAIIFHFFNIDQAFMALISCILGIKCIIAAAGTAATDLQAGNKAKWKIAIILNRISRVPIVSASRWVETTLKTLTRLPSGSRVVKNGIDVDSFIIKRDMRLECRLPRDGFVLGMVARLESSKDHVTLIKGFAQFVSAVPEANAELRIIGEGPLRNELEILTKKLDLSNRIFFFGLRSDVPKQLAELDVFVFSTTRKEGFGNVLIEALAAGVPIIANDIPSSNEVLMGGKFGTLVSCAEPQAWARALERFWNEGPKILPPKIEEIKVIYGMAQFCEAYLDILGLDERK